MRIFSKGTRRSLGRFGLLVWLAVLFPLLAPSGVESAPEGDFVAVIGMDMMILPGTQAYLKKSIDQAAEEGAKLLVVKLDTPGGMLNTSQEMIQILFKSPIPVVIYVAPSGSTATSAGVFITMAGHIAAMAPGTSIGAAHPVSGEGKDIEGDMRKKVENMAVAMVKSISEERGRNFEWAEQAVKDSSSLTEKEALDKKVVDVIASDVGDLLEQLKGREVKLGSEKIKLDDYSSLPRRYYQMAFKDKSINVLADPNIAALLWLAATTGISLELYNPGAILPGMVGVICLILALAVSQIIPISQGGVALMVLGGLLIGAEMYVGSGILGVGGVIALVLGSIYLVDVSVAPDLKVALEFVIPVAVVMGVFMLFVVHGAVSAFRRKVMTGNEGLLGQRGTVSIDLDPRGKVFVEGTYWNAVVRGDNLPKDTDIKVVAIQSGMLLEVEKFTNQEE